MAHVETRARLLAAATTVFSELGYQAATTRMICDRAHANAAAINYHFGDKLGLYTEVLAAVLGEECARMGGEVLLQIEPEAALREFITRLFNSMINFENQDHPARMMAHELAQPTPALAAVVERVIRPRALRLSDIVSRIIGSRPTSLQTRLAVHSVIAQVAHYMHSQPMIKLLWTDWKLDSKAKEAIVEHITRFSLNGLRGLRAPSKANVGSRRSKPNNPC